MKKPAIRILLGLLVVIAIITIHNNYTEAAVQKEYSGQYEKKVAQIEPLAPENIIPFLASELDKTTIALQESTQLNKSYHKRTKRDFQKIKDLEIKVQVCKDLMTNLNLEKGDLKNKLSKLKKEHKKLADVLKTKYRKEMTLLKRRLNKISEENAQLWENNRRLRNINKKLRQALQAIQRSQKTRQEFSNQVKKQTQELKGFLGK